MRDFFHRTRESTEYTVLHTSVYMGKNQQIIFFIHDANLTSIKSFAVPAAKHRIRTASSYRAISVV